MPYSLAPKKRPLGGGGAPAAAGRASPGPGATPAGQPAGGASPGYVNFSRLLAVNQGGAQRMADSLVGQVQQKGQEAANQIQGARQDFQGKVQAGTLNYQAPGPAPQQVGGMAGRARDAQGGGVSPELYRTAGALSAQAKQGYTGPKDWNAAGYDTVAMQGAARGAADAAKNLTTAGGRGAMLRAQAQGPYTAGMSSLDAALSGAALGSRGEELSALYSNLGQQLTDYQNEGGAAVEAATTASNAAASQYGTDAARYQAMADEAALREEEAKRQRGFQQGAAAVNQALPRGGGGYMRRVGRAMGGG